MTDSPNLDVTLMTEAQGSKWVTFNEFVYNLDVKVNAKLVSTTTATPPGSPAEGDIYLVAASPTGAWSGQAGKLAAYQESTWVFYTLHAGFTYYNAGDSKLYVYNGTSHVEIAKQSDLSSLSSTVSSLSSTVSSNTADIATNAADIAQNAADIAQNASDIAALGGGGGTFSMERVAFTSSGTWTKDANLYAIRVRCVAGGGGGGSSNAAGAGVSSAGGGGASGSYAEKFILAADLGATETVTIGAAGAGGTSGGDGSTGGTTSFGSHISCLGGGGGAAGGTAGSNFSARLGGIGQAATGGDVNVNGNPGSLGYRNAQVGMGGMGGGSPFGAGGGPIVTASTPGANDGTGKGAGGGGSATGQSSAANNGGVGTAGYVEVMEYYVS